MEVILQIAVTCTVCLQCNSKNMLPNGFHVNHCYSVKYERIKPRNCYNYHDMTVISDKITCAVFLMHKF